MPASAQDRLDYLQSIKPEGYHLIKSETLGRSFHIYVNLPRAYDWGDDNYPVIYLLDGGMTYPVLSSYFLLMTIDEPMPEAIIVGISYGATSPADGNFRSTDYTLPSKEREHWGGAPQFIQFLDEELLPFIDANYRTDPSHRVLFGQSLGGQFAIYAAMMRPDLFWGYIASNPALHRNLDVFLGLEPNDIPAKTNLFVAYGTRDNERFVAPRVAWLDKWTEKPHPWKMDVEILEDEYHASAAPLAFRAGMRWLFSGDSEVRE
ncbi:alpha/beta hydrolase [Hyphococcus sp. DH-69]|uniref:alpha/beta hydrolase n=1 Tax=Hyphococcus formosus TaxID=3143534 RepID=UPI00398B4F1F